MPNVGPLELGLILLAVAVPCGIGYWCMTVFRSRGKSAGAGFALGFVLTFFLSLIGAVIAVVISYAQSGPTPYATPAPSPPTLIATFGPTTGWVGKVITYDHRGFIIGGVGGVSAQGVLFYDEQGQIEWANDGMRDWVAGMPGPGSSSAT
jgi:ABC-type transport system involved in multi-copper enzyme maturation permease subunit